MPDIMLDLECLSVRPHAVILVIGAIKFERNGSWSEQVDEKGLTKFDTFYKRITINSCLSKGLHIDKETQKWWDNQTNDIKYESLENPDRITLDEALIEFKNWFGTNSKTHIWGNGSGFDCSILGEAYKRCGMDIPWKFWMERDLRTIMDIGKVNNFSLPQYNKHHALYDAYRQIIGLQLAIKNICKTSDI